MPILLTRPMEAAIVSHDLRIPMIAYSSLKNIRGSGGLVMTFKNLRNGAVALVIRGGIYRGFHFGRIVGLLARFSYQRATLVEGGFKSMSTPLRTREIDRLTGLLCRDWLDYLQFESIYVDDDLRFEDENWRELVKAWRVEGGELIAERWMTESIGVLENRYSERARSRLKFEAKRKFQESIRISKLKKK